MRLYLYVVHHINYIYTILIKALIINGWDLFIYNSDTKTKHLSQ